MRELTHQAGARLTEYALIIALLALGVLALLLLFGGQLAATYSRIMASLLVCC